MVEKERSVYLKIITLLVSVAMLFSAFSSLAFADGEEPSGDGDIETYGDDQENVDDPTDHIELQEGTSTVWIHLNGVESAKILILSPEESAGAASDDFDWAAAWASEDVKEVTDGTSVEVPFNSQIAIQGVQDKYLLTQQGPTLADAEASSKVNNQVGSDVTLAVSEDEETYFIISAEDTQDTSSSVENPDGSWSLPSSTWGKVSPKPTAETPFPYKAGETYEGDATATDYWLNHIRFQIDSGILADIGVKTMVGNCMQHPRPAPGYGDTFTYYLKITKVDPVREKIWYDVVFYPNHSPATGRVTNLGSGTVTTKYGKIQTFSQSAERSVAPKTGYVSAIKKSAGEISNGLGTYDLGAQYQLFLDEACTKGAQDADGRTAILTTNASTGKSNALEMEVGTYYVKEIRAPKGHALSNAKVCVKINTTHTSDSPLAFTYTNKEKYGALEIGKVDADSGTTTPQGDASLSGTEFTIKYYDASSASGSPKKTWVFKTPSGATQTLTEAMYVRGSSLYKVGGNMVFPLGTYVVTEASAPTGYLVNDSSFTVKLNDTLGNTSTATYVGKGGAKVGDEVKRGEVSILKRELETKKEYPLEGSTFVGTTFEVISDSAKPVFVLESEGSTNGKWFNKGEVVKTIRILDDNGTPAKTGKVLPYGHYLVKEVKADNAPSHHMSDTTTRRVFVNEHGQTFAATPVDNQVYRGAIQFKKRLGDAQALSNIPFLIRNVETGEAHVVVTNNNGILRSDRFGLLQPASTKEHSYNTNANDYVLDENGNPIVDEQGLIDESRLDYNAGVWFGIDKKGNKAPVDDDQLSLPYGNYTITELKVQKNKSYKLIDKSTFQVTNDMTSFEVELENNPDPKIGTTAKDNQTNENIGRIGAEVTIVDTVAYEGFDNYIGRAVTVVGTLMDKETGEAILDKDGKEITSTARFTPTASEGTVEMSFTVDSTVLAGKDIVVFESTRQGRETGMEIAYHADINDEGQTIHFPSVGTQADRAMTTDSHKVIDTVSVKNLVVGKEFTINGTLIDKATKEPMKDKDGNNITATKTFTADAKDMEVALEFDVSNTDYIGKTGVVYEKLFYSGIEVANHEDPEDPKQTVEFPSPKYNMYKVRNEDAPEKAKSGKYGFYFGDTVTYTTVIENQGNVDLIMDVSDGFVEPEKFSLPIVVSVKNAIQNLLSEDKSTVNITIKAGETAEVVHSAVVKYDIPEYLADATEDSDSTKDGLDCNRVDKDNTPDDNDGYVNFAKTSNVKYIDPKDPDNPKDYPNGDKKDDAQTPVQKPQIGTNAIDKETADHISLKGDEITVIDEVSYGGLTVGKEYTLTGELKNKKTGETVATGETTFTPDANRGMVEVEFVFSSKGNETFVAFEELYDIEGNLVTEHKDLEDEDQTVYVPEIGTTANLSKTTVEDKIEYKNLLKDRKYVARGFLVNAKGEKLKGSDGATAFTAKDSNGSVVVKLPIKYDLAKLAGMKLTAYEEVYIVNEEGIETLVAVHKDLDDKKQTVEIPKVKSPDTGDSNLIYFYGLLIVLSVAGIVGMRRLKAIK